MLHCLEAEDYVRIKHQGHYLHATLTCICISICSSVINQPKEKQRIYMHHFNLPGYIEIQHLYIPCVFPVKLGGTSNINQHVMFICPQAV